MATVTKSRAKKAQQFGGVPYGNTTTLRYNLTTNASGVLVESDQTTALVQTNVVRLGVLPAGLEIHDALMIVSDAFTAATTAKVGFQYVDGVDVTATPEDDDYFTASLVTNAVGRYMADNTAVAPVTLPKDAYLILTIAGADHAAAGVCDILVRGVGTGQA